MNEEIKEICHKCKKYPAEHNQTYCEFCLGISDKDDYITNLQEELKSANESITWWTNRFNVLQKENNILKENAEHNDKVVDKARWSEMLYKSRNEKAIEYINERRKYKGEPFYLDEIQTEIVFDILQGEDKVND